MKKIIVVVSDEVAGAWLGLLDLKELVSLTVEDVPQVAQHPKKISRFTRLSGTDSRRELAKHYAIGVPFSSQAAAKYLQTLGYHGSTASAALSLLNRHGFVQHAGPLGHWAFVKAIPSDHSFKLGE